MLLREKLTKSLWQFFRLGLNKKNKLREIKNMNSILISTVIAGLTFQFTSSNILAEGKWLCVSSHILRLFFQHI